MKKAILYTIVIAAFFVLMAVALFSWMISDEKKDSMADVRAAKERKRKEREAEALLSQIVNEIENDGKQETEEGFEPESEKD